MSEKTLSLWRDVFLARRMFGAAIRAEGIDCSGLVQVAFRACGIPCPGDSDLQAGMPGVALGSRLTPLQRVIWFSGKVMWPWQPVRYDHDPCKCASHGGG